MGRTSEKHEKMREAFCQAFVLDPHENATKAAIAAGYAKSHAKGTAHHLLKRPDVRARIAELREDAVEEIGLGIPHVAQRLDAIYRRCMSAVPVMEYDRETGEDVPTGEWTFDSKGAIKATEALMRLLGMADSDRIALLPAIVIEGIYRDDGTEADGNPQV